MKSNFERSLMAVLVHEGGYVNHPRDPGGATNRGVTQRTYDEWRTKHQLPKRTVKEITQSEVITIYKHLYWDAVKGDDLPIGIDYCVFDFAFNSGPSRAAKYLQRAVHVNPDGHIGPMTLQATRARTQDKTVDAICDARMEFLRGLDTFDTFGKGWTRRVDEVRKLAKAMK